MIRKLIIFITGFYGLIVLFLILQSCDLLRYDASICHIDFFGINCNSWDSIPDDLTNEIGFEVRADDNCKSAYFLRDFSLISSCYATTKCPDWQNDLDVSTYDLSFDRLIIVNNDSLKPGINILENGYIKSNVKIEKDKGCPLITSTIRISGTIKNKMVLDTGIYIATFRCKITDGKEFEKQRKVILKK
jgi:hypothetical protein